MMNFTIPDLELERDRDEFRYSVPIYSMAKILDINISILYAACYEYDIDISKGINNYITIRKNKFLTESEFVNHLKSLSSEVLKRYPYLKLVNTKPEPKITDIPKKRLEQIINRMLEYKNYLPDASMLITGSDTTIYFKSYNCELSIDNRSKKCVLMPSFEPSNIGRSCIELAKVYYYVIADEENLDQLFLETIKRDPEVRREITKVLGG